MESSGGLRLHGQSARNSAGYPPEKDENNGIIIYGNHGIPRGISVSGNIIGTFEITETEP